ATTQPELAGLDLLTSDLRSKVILAGLSLGGFREQTLASLEYRHVKEDLEAGVTPVHVHVEAEITKSHYADYDTFLGHDAVQYLKEYLSARRKGIRILATVRSPGLMLKPEEIRDDSPLLRDEQYYRRHSSARPISRKQVYQIVHQLYFKAGLIETSERSNSRSQQLKAAGRDPEKYLRKEALSEPHRIVVSGQYSQEEQARALLAALRDYVTDGLAAKS